MKDLQELCNVNIPNSLHSLFEASLLDIEGTFKDGDEFNEKYGDLIEEFDNMKKLFTKQGKYEKIKAPKGYVYTLRVPAKKLIDFSGAKTQCNGLMITINPPGGFHNKRYSASVCLCDIYSRSYYEKIHILDKITESSAGKVIKECITPLFDNFKTFLEKFVKAVQ